jgi:hypothetical protein
MSTTNITNSLLNLKENKISQVRASLGSLFTKDDVVSIIDDLFADIDNVLIEQTSPEVTNGITKEVVLKIVSDAIDDIDSSFWKDCSEVDDCEFSLNYNEVQLDDYSLSFDTSSIKREVLAIVNTQYDNNVEDVTNAEA